MTGPSLDMDALRGRLARIDFSPYMRAILVDDFYAVLALVEEQRRENERLRGALTGLHAESRDLILRRRIERILAAGSPAENKEQRDWRRPCACGHAIYQHPGNACMGHDCNCQQYTEEPS